MVLGLVAPRLTKTRGMGSTVTQRQRLRQRLKQRRGHAGAGQSTGAPADSTVGPADQGIRIFGRWAPVPCWDTARACAA